MRQQKPDPNSNTTWRKAEDLAEGRGCFPHNYCWPECVEAAHYTIVEGELDDWDRKLMHMVHKRQYAGDKS